MSVEIVVARAVVIDNVAHTNGTIGHLLGGLHQIIPFPRATRSVDFVRENEPDIVFVSLELPAVSGTGLVSRLAELPDAPPVISILGDGDPRRIVASVQSRSI